MRRADMGPRATGKEAVATVVVDKMRRRMRQNGYHAHITLQVHPSAPALNMDNHLVCCKQRIVWMLTVYILPLQGWVR